MGELHGQTVANAINADLGFLHYLLFHTEIGDLAVDRGPLVYRSEWLLRLYLLDLLAVYGHQHRIDLTDSFTYNSVDAATRVSIALSSFLACKPLAPLLKLAFFCARNSCSINCSCRSLRMARTGAMGSSCSRLFDNAVAVRLP